MPKFAEGSVVTVQRSRGHLEQLLHAHGAEGFAYGWTADHDRVEFVWKGQRVRFTLPCVDRNKHLLTPAGRTRNDNQLQVALDQEDRRRWRALLLVVRAKIEAVETGISIFEEEFLAFIVMSNDRTVGDILVPRIADGTINKKLLTAGAS